MVSNFEWSDSLDAVGPWPGGSRYGLTVKRTFERRTWSHREYAEAERYGVTLPTMDYMTREVWWDGPMHAWVELLRHTDEFGEITYTQEARCARRWVQIKWDYAPPWDRGRAECVELPT